MKSSTITELLRNHNYTWCGKATLRKLARDGDAVAKLVLKRRRRK